MIKIKLFTQIMYDFLIKYTRIFHFYRTKLFSLADKLLHHITVICIFIINSFININICIPYYSY